MTKSIEIDPLSLTNGKNDYTVTDDDSGKQSIQFSGDLCEV